MPITDGEGEQLGSMELNDPESIDFVNQFKEAGDYLSSGVKKFENNDFQGAISDFNKSIAILPSRDAFYNSGLARHSEGDYQGAISDFSSAIEMQSIDFASYANRGLSKHSINDFVGAMSDYTKAIEINPNYSSAYHNRAVTAGLGLGDEMSACEDFKKAMSLGNTMTSEWFKGKPPMCIKMPANLENNLPKRATPSQMNNDSIPKNGINCPNFIHARGKEKYILIAEIFGLL